MMPFLSAGRERDGKYSWVSVKFKHMHLWIDIPEFIIYLLSVLHELFMMI